MKVPPSKPSLRVEPSRTRMYHFIPNGDISSSRGRILGQRESVAQSGPSPRAPAYSCRVFLLHGWK
jgi:hypothetical protein